MSRRFFLGPIVSPTFGKKINWMLSKPCKCSNVFDLVALGYPVHSLDL
jgi:hypothetical protein